MRPPIRLRNSAGADPFVIALARVHGGVVVTEETQSRNLTKPKIPDVCDSMGVPWLNLMGFVQEQGWVFRQPHACDPSFQPVPQAAHTNSQPTCDEVATIDSSRAIPARAESWPAGGSRLVRTRHGDSDRAIREEITRPARAARSRDSSRVRWKSEGR